MKALVKTEAAPGLELVEVDEPTLGPADVLIDVTKAAICGTDLHIYQWDQWAQDTVQTPVTLGHEFMGVVAAVGETVTNIEVGQRVAGEGHIICGQCRNCRSGSGHLCRATQGVGIHRNGGFAERVVIPAENAYPIPDSISDDVAAILDPLGNAVHSALSFDLVGEDVLITGAGPIGQMAAAVCRHAGARFVVITDVEQKRLQTAEQMGATRGVLAGEENIREAMADLGVIEGFDVALEMSGSPHALADLVSVINHGGKIGLLGLFAQDATVDVNQVIFKGLTVKGIYGREMFDTWYKATAMLNSGLDITPIISHRFPLQHYDEAFEALSSGEASKILLEIG